jgi:hypothetical protein
MIRILRYGSLIASLMLGLACDTEQPTAPRVPAPPTSTQPAPPPSLPSSAPAATYVFSDRLDYAISRVTAESQYLLLADSGAGHGRQT